MRWDHEPCMPIVTLDKKGRVVIPKEQREELGLADEDELAVAVERGEIRLKPIVRKQFKARAGRKWGREAFLKAGEASFVDDE